MLRTYWGFTLSLWGTKSEEGISISLFKWTKQMQPVPLSVVLNKQKLNQYYHFIWQKKEEEKKKRKEKKEDRNHILIFLSRFNTGSGKRFSVYTARCCFRERVSAVSATAEQPRNVPIPYQQHRKQREGRGGGRGSRHQTGMVEEKQISF